MRPSAAPDAPKLTPAVLHTMCQLQCADVMDLATLKPYTHAFSSATCKGVTNHIFELASDTPVRVTTFYYYVDEAVKKFNGTRSDTLAPKERILNLSVSGTPKTMSNFIFTGGCLQSPTGTYKLKGYSV